LLEAPRTTDDVKLIAKVSIYGAFVLRASVGALPSANR
jgi:hypothetical protein